MRPPGPLLVVLALACAGCGYRPTLFGGGDPATLDSPHDHRFSVTYHASCDGRCEISYMREDGPRVVEASGAWQERVGIGAGTRGMATLRVRPLAAGGRVESAAIDVDGRRLARIERATDAAVELTALLNPPDRR